MKSVDCTIHGLLLNDATRVAGSAVINGKNVTWKDGYILTVLPFGDKRGEARKYTVMPELADSIALQLMSVGWGSLVTLTLEGNLVTELVVNLDWSDAVAN